MENEEKLKVGVLVPKELVGKAAVALLAMGNTMSLIGVYDAIEKAVNGLMKIREALVAGGLDEMQADAFVFALGQVALSEKFVSAMKAIEEKKAANEESDGEEEKSEADEKGAEESGGGGVNE